MIPIALVAILVVIALAFWRLRSSKKNAIALAPDEPRTGLGTTAWLASDFIGNSHDLMAPSTSGDAKTSTSSGAETGHEGSGDNDSTPDSSNGSEGGGSE